MKQSLENAGQEKKNYTSSPFQGPSFLFFSFVSIVSASMFIWNPEAVVKEELRVIISFVDLLLSKFTDILCLWVGDSPIP